MTPDLEILKDPVTLYVGTDDGWQPIGEIDSETQSLSEEDVNTAKELQDVINLWGELIMQAAFSAKDIRAIKKAARAYRKIAKKNAKALIKSGVHIIISIGDNSINW